MTGGLEKKRCIPCEGGIPPLSDEESNRFLDQINEDWILVENHHIERIWKFDETLFPAITFDTLSLQA